MSIWLEVYRKSQLNSGVPNLEGPVFLAASRMNPALVLNGSAEARRDMVRNLLLTYYPQAQEQDAVVAGYLWYDEVRHMWAFCNKVTNSFEIHDQGGDDPIVVSVTVSNDQPFS